MGSSICSGLAGGILHELSAHSVACTYSRSHGRSWRAMVRRPEAVVGSFRQAGEHRFVLNSRIRPGYLLPQTKQSSSGRCKTNNRAVCQSVPRQGQTNGLTRKAAEKDFRQSAGWKTTGLESDQPGMNRKLNMSSLQYAI